MSGVQVLLSLVPAASPMKPMAKRTLHALGCTESCGSYWGSLEASCVLIKASFLSLAALLLSIFLVGNCPHQQYNSCQTVQLLKQFIS